MKLEIDKEGIGIVFCLPYKMQSWLWFISGKCHFCGGKLDEPYSYKKQFCSECNRNNG